MQVFDWHVRTHQGHAPSLLPQGIFGATGSFDWYPNAGGKGFTDIRPSNGANFTSLQFSAAEGYYLGSNLEYQVLESGVIIGSGNLGPLDYSLHDHTFGFSGTPFDEVRLQAVPGAVNFANNPPPGSSQSATFDTLAIDNVAFRSAAAPQALTPSTYELAQMSADAYSSQPQAAGISGYHELSVIAGKNGLQLVEYGSNSLLSNGKPAEIILAIRGTQNQQDIAGYVKNLLSDATVGTGLDSTGLADYVSDTSKVLQTLASTYAGSTIQLTGHSLGGTIAEALGKAYGLNATGFDAPGAQGVYNELLAGEHVTPLGPAGTLSDYRQFGDQISLVGNQVGSVVTLGSAASTASGIIPTSSLDLGRIFTDSDSGEGHTGCSGLCRCCMPPSSEILTDGTRRRSRHSE
jgi:hypothetical protein